MPNVVIDGPKIDDIEIKRTLIKEITDVLEKVYKIPRSAYVIVINEHSPENVGVAGTLLIDRKE